MKRISPVMRAVSGRSPMTAIEVIDLPQPDSPTRPMVSPGRTENRSPARSSSTGARRSERTASARGAPSSSRTSTASVEPDGEVSVTTVTSLAPSSSRARSASPERYLARASAKRPARRKVVTQAADSKYMWAMWPEERGMSSMLMRIPSSPAPPQMRAHRLQPVAAMTPIDTSVSMVKAPCLIAPHAALWKGQAPQVATGRAIAATAHCQP